MTEPDADPTVRVHVHWLSRGGTRTLARWWRRASDPTGLVRAALDSWDLPVPDLDGGLTGCLVGLALGIAVVIALALATILIWWVLVPLLLAVLDAVVLLVLLLAGVATRILLGRPWLVTVQRNDDVLAERSVTGWRRARNVRDHATAAIAAGVDPADALAEASDLSGH